MRKEVEDLKNKIKALDKDELSDVAHLVLDLIVDRDIDGKALPEEEKDFVCKVIAETILGK